MDFEENVTMGEAKDFVIVDEIEASLHPELQKRIYDSYIKSHHKKRFRPIKTFSEFIIDAERTNEIHGKLHRLIGNKTNTDALKIITRAMWIGWIERPTATSIKNEFPTIVCSCQMISKCLNEVKPTHPNNAIEKIRQDYERA